MSEGMKRITDLGEVGDTVRTRIAVLRQAQNLSYAALARRLDNEGRALGTLALRRIEAGARRVDVDDLVALANALNTTTTALMLDKEWNFTNPIPCLECGAGVLLPEAHQRWHQTQPETN
jgi:transcriptional regulator with XRE-family HTH domain